jgi:O-antigen/teichoic acid export membrane protein
LPVTDESPDRGDVLEPRRTSVLRNGLYNVGGQTLRGAVGLLAIPFLIRFLGLREYGVWSLAYAVFALMTMSEAGISIAATVFLSKDLADHDSREVGRTLTLILIGAVLLSAVLGLLLWTAGPFIVRPLAAFGIAERADAGRALQIGGFAVSTLILQRTLVGIEQAFDRYATINILDLSQSLLANVGLVVVAWLGGKTIELMKWQLFACVILLVAHSCIVSQLLQRRELRFGWSGNKAWRIFRYSVATWSATLGTAAFGQCDRIIVGGVLGAPVLGIYSAITNMTSRINAFSGTAVQPLVPSLSRDVATNVSVEGRIRQAVHLNALIAVETGIFLYVLAGWVMKAMIPGATEPRDILGLQIATVIYVLYSLNAPGYYILFSVDKVRTNAVVVLSSGIVTLGLILLGARYFGLLGALAGNAGYLATLWLTVVGVRMTGIAIRRYLAWITLPSVWLAVALIVGAVLGQHQWWGAVFVAVQAVLAMFWFVHHHGKRHWRDLLRVFRPSSQKATIDKVLHGYHGG